MPADYGFRFENAEDTTQLAGRELASLLQRRRQYRKRPFLLPARPDDLTMFAGEYVQLLPEDEYLEVFVIAGEASDAEEVDEGGA